MRIVITSGHSLEGETGSALIVANLARELSKNSEVLYFQLGKTFLVKKLTTDLTLLTIPAFNFNGIIFPYLTPSVIKGIYSELAKFRPDVIHGQNIIFGSLVAIIWARRNSIPFIFTLHAPPHQDLIYVYPQLEKNKIFSFIDKVFTYIYNGNIVSSSNLVIALNTTIINSLKVIAPNTPRIIINNGVPLNGLKRLRIKQPNKKVYFVFTGSFLDRKNQAFLLKVFKHLPKNFILSLYGLKSSGGKYLKHLQTFKDQNNLHNVRIFDYVTGDKLNSAYDSANYMMSASIKEVQSLSFIEALAAGKPIIALENESTQDIIKTSKCLILPKSTSPKDFAESVIKYVKKTNKIYSLVSKECRLASRRFDITKVSSKITSVYKSTIGTYRKVNGGNDFALQTFLGISVAISIVGKLAFKLSRSFRK